MQIPHSQSPKPASRKCDPDYFQEVFGGFDPRADQQQSKQSKGAAIKGVSITFLLEQPCHAAHALNLADVLQHIVQRGFNREPCFRKHIAMLTLLIVLQRESVLR